MRRRILLACACAAGVPLASFVSPAFAQPDLTQKAGPSVADAPSDSYRFDRFELDSADGGRRYRVQLAVPRAAPPPSGFPVLYLLDGNAAFAALTQAQLASMAAQDPPLVIAAIGYATDLRFDLAARTYDYTPPVPEGGVASAAASADAARGRRTGGADVFLDLIETRIKPAVETRTTIDLARQSLWGHSYGGLFVLHTLLNRPKAFQTYIAADPSLWWADGFILRDNAALPVDGVRLLVMTGGAQTPVRADGPAGVDPATVARVQQARRAAPPDAAQRFVARQAQRPGVQARLREFDGIAHGPMLALSLGPAIDLAAGTGPP